jgi:uncharacterized damage-inducible protein DinB
MIPMNELLIEAFRHGAWATKALITASRGLSTAQLNGPARGYGSILATLDHVVNRDAQYLATLTAVRSAWAGDGSDTDDLDQLEARASETARLWERFLAGPVDSEHLLSLDGGSYECHASVVVAQAPHHGTAHREQVRAALKELGVQTPDVQPWEYALETGRARWREGKT